MKCVAFYRNFRYEGVLISSDEDVYEILDEKTQKIIILPINNTVLVKDNEATK